MNHTQVHPDFTQCRQQLNVIPNSVSMHGHHCCFGLHVFFFDVLATAAISYLKLVMLPSTQRNLFTPP